MQSATVAARVTGVDTVQSSCRTQEQELTTLIRRFAQGDEEAFTAFYEASSAFVQSLAWRILRDQEAAAEISMDVYTQVYQQISHYNPDRGAPLAWLATLTRSRAIDRWRKEAVRQQGEAGLAPDAYASSRCEPETYSSVAERQYAVRAALAALRPHQRQVIEVAYYEGLSHREIAIRLGKPLGTVKTHLRTGLRDLRDLLTPVLTEAEAPETLPSQMASIPL